MSSQDPFFVSQSNKRGLILFLMASLLVIFVPRIAMWVDSDTSYVISSEEITQLSSARQRYEFKSANFGFKKKKPRVYLPPPKKFDPNMYTDMDWEKLGLSHKQADVVVKFCSRGIYSNDQLQKIFVIPDRLYQLIKDSTYYPSRIMNKVYDNSKIVEIEKQLVLVDINRADEQELDKVPGVGSFYAKNIMNYRKKLGGFVHKEQLMEVWKMDPVKYSEIERFLYVDPMAVNKIDVNEVSVEVLRKHPYFNWNTANSVVKLRAQKNGFTSLEELKESVLIDQEMFEKIKPYLIL
jgi:competence protein ComEA